ncbi:transcriptional repressor [Alicyclobacillus fastidiosus]|uniref:transcriptional repressor n=1 Tax=Alicyclobacillus fastidiosus TaxID=392011 RepID=UPI0034DCD361
MILDELKSVGSAKYRLACEIEHHHHLICLRCGSTVVLDKCPMADVLATIDDFTIINHRFEVYGHCTSCAQVL